MRSEVDQKIDAVRLATGQHVRPETILTAERVRAAAVFLGLRREDFKPQTRETTR